MKLVVSPPISPMLAKRVSALPEGDSWIFEPKCRVALNSRILRGLVIFRHVNRG